MFRTNQFIIRRLVLTRSIQYVYGCMSCLVANTLWVNNQLIYLAEFYLVVSSEFHWVKRRCSKTLSHPLSGTSVLLILPTGWVWDPAEVWSVASLSLTHRECHWTKPLFLLVSQDSKQNHSSSDLTNSMSINYPGCFLVSISWITPVTWFVVIKSIVF